jgi:tripartite-type tricarboxylate transporter receptor subunit TctC
MFSKKNRRAPNARRESTRRKHMRMKSRSLLHAVSLAAALAAASGIMPAEVQAQAYPSQDIRLICAFPPGSGADVLVRYFGEKLRPITGRTVIVENKSGAGGNIATEYVARAKPDGYTIYVHAATAVAANQHLFKKPPVEAAKAIQIAASINRQPFMLVVDAKSPYKTVADLTAAMKPKGELLSGKVDYGMHDPVFSLAQQREGRLRILAVSTGKRLEANPEAPTMAESGVPMDLTGWWAAMLPAGTPKPVVDKVNQWFGEIVKTEETRKFLNSFGGDPFINTPDVAHELFLKSINDWGNYVRIAKITPQ